MDDEREKLWTKSRNTETEGPQSPNRTLFQVEEDTPQKPESVWWTVCGYGSALTSIVAWTISTSCAQALGGFVPSFELNLWRFSIMFLFVIPVVAFRKVTLIPEKGQCIFLTLYCLTTCFYNLTIYEAAIYVPVGTLGGLESSIVILLTAIIQMIVVTRRCIFEITVAVVLCCIGAVLMIQPEFVFTFLVANRKTHRAPVCLAPTKTEYDNATQLDVTDLWSDGVNTSHLYSKNTTSHHSTFLTDDTKGYLLVFTSSVLYVAVIYVVKRLKDVDTVAVLFWKGLSSIAISGVLMLALETPTCPTSATCIMLLLGQSICSVTADVATIVAILLLPPFTFSVLTSLLLVTNLCVQYTALKNVNPGHRNPYEVIGAIVVLVGCIFEPVNTVFRKWREATSS